MYPNIPSGIRPVPHGDGHPVPDPPDNFAAYSDDEDSVSSNSEEQQPSASRDADYLPSTDSSKHKITDGELNDLIRDLELPENKAELLVWKLHQWNLLHQSVKVTTSRIWNHEFEQFFKTVVISPTVKTLMVWWMQCIWGTVVCSGDYSLMPQIQVLNQSSYTMEISCLPFLCGICFQHKRNVYSN